MPCIHRAKKDGSELVPEFRELIINNTIDACIEAGSKIADVDPWNAVNYNQLGTLYLQMGNKEQAKNVFQKIIDFAPNTEQAQLAKTNLEKL
jgi:Flp pilus assembly protein TadD